MSNVNDSGTWVWVSRDQLVSAGVSAEALRVFDQIAKGGERALLTEFWANALYPARALLQLTPTHEQQAWEPAR